MLFLSPTFCRSAPVEEESDGDIEEAEYEGEDAAVIDDAVDDGDARLDSQAQFSDYKKSSGQTANLLKSNDDIRVLHRFQQPNRYIESDTNDQSEISQHLTNRDVNNFKENHMQQGVPDEFNKPTIQQIDSSNEDDAFFENRNRAQLNNLSKNIYNNEVADSNESPRFSNQYRNIVQKAKKRANNDKTSDNIHYKLNRGKRRTEEVYMQETELSSDMPNKESSDESIDESDESAIKRHIKKLSGEELKELLNSLSEDKKVLLNKIIENDQNAENINKREITKKAGAIEENIYLESGISDSSKILSSSALVDSTETVSSRNTNTTENTKEPENQSEVPEVSTVKNNHPESFESKREIKSSIDEVNQKHADENSNNCALTTINKNEANVESNAQVTSKNENKREIAVDELANIDVSFDNTKYNNDLNLIDSLDPSIEQNYVCPQDEDLSELRDDETQPYNSGHNNKRDTYTENEIDLTDSIKSLEESFPKENGYDESNRYSESNLVPLVRVKRKNDEVAVQKRALAIFPDTKVAYCPYKAENVDEDNDEGNEFEDDGFYDKTSNYAKNNLISKLAEDSRSKVRSNLHVNVKNDINLGSDTDNVLSGVEGVDDNLMYNSGSRKRRNTKDNTELYKSEKAAPLIDEMKTFSSTHENMLSYQSNDAFGPLPQNSEGDLGRNKRIRHLKSLSDH
ncbi:putative uncharacterized protein DDB_G0282499 [Galleria mellonella]|uniref:Uncharacterized protein n=1 Tax=Galleria mellonella TaxID=7137 RepID=A0A6J1X823_GALME|nr:putative uncharacterized protein DDB_G0282499 [Galleria mellonella]